MDGKFLKTIFIAKYLKCQGNKSNQAGESSANFQKYPNFRKIGFKDGQILESRNLKNIKIYNANKKIIKNMLILNCQKKDNPFNVSIKVIPK